MNVSIKVSSLSCDYRSRPFGTTAQRWTLAPIVLISHSAGTQDHKHVLHYTYLNQCSRCLKKYRQLKHLKQKDDPPDPELSDVHQQV